MSPFLAVEVDLIGQLYKYIGSLFTQSLLDSHRYSLLFLFLAMRESVQQKQEILQNNIQYIHRVNIIAVFSKTTGWPAHLAYIYRKILTLPYSLSPWASLMVPM